MKVSFLKEEFEVETPFKNRNDVEAEIRTCDRFGGICQWACFIFAAVGVLGDAVDVTIGLAPTSWFLLAIVVGINAVIGHLHVVIAKHLLGIQAEE